MANPRKRKAAIKKALTSMLESNDPEVRRQALEFMSQPGPDEQTPGTEPVKADEEWLTQRALEMGIIAEEKTPPKKAAPTKTATTKKAPIKKTSTKKTTGKSKKTSTKKTAGKSKS